MPAHNSFITNLIRQKIYVAIDGQTVNDLEDGKRFVLFLPEWEMHEPGLLAFNYILRNSGHRVIYIGQNTSLEDLEMVVEKHQPDYLLTFFNSPVDAGIIRAYLDELSAIFEKTHIYISGIQVRNLDSELPANISNISSAADFRAGILSA